MIKENLVNTINHYTYKPSFIFHKEKSEKSKLFIGFELEVKDMEYYSRTKSIKELFKNTEKIHNTLLYLKYDSSITEGFEIVSHPFTLSFAHKYMKLKKFFTILKEEGFYVDDRCGLHFHLSKDFFSSYELQKLKLFFSINLKQLKKIGGRKVYTYCRYYNYSIKNIISKSFTIVPDDKMLALSIGNTYNPFTAEIRIFKSTINYKEFMYRLQFVEAIALYVKQTGILAINNKKSWKYFVKWIKAQNRYFFLEKKLRCKLYGE